MLENHYEHVKVRKLANVFSGHDKRRQLTQDSKNADLRQQLAELKEQNAQLEEDVRESLMKACGAS